MKKTRKTTIFFSGMAMGTGVLGLIQDIMGKEAYLAYAKDHWVEAPVSVPIMVFAILIGVCGLVAVWKED